MTIVDLLEINSSRWGDDVALVEVNPEQKETRHSTWRDYDLVASSVKSFYRREITWKVFNEKANRFANALISCGIKKEIRLPFCL